jgi:CheY-like chemotaxis protein
MISQRIISNHSVACSTSIAVNGLDAIKKLQSEIFDYILLDINMPKMNGWQFLNALQASSLKAKSKIYILSSSIDETDITTAKTHPLVIDFIEKPLSLDKLAEIIK